MEKQLTKIKLLEFDPKDAFTILSKGYVVNLKFDEITHICKYGNESVIYTATGSYRTYHSLPEILQDLPVNDFFRASKSHVIAMAKVERFTGKKIHLNGCVIPLANYYRLQLCRHLQQMLNSRYEYFITSDEPESRAFIRGDAAGHEALPEKRAQPAL